jgi:uncharacterized membrane protein
MTHLRFRLRQLAYDLGSGLYFRPAIVVVALAGVAVAVSATMRAGDGAAWTSPGEPGAAQVVLGTIASSMMTVVSVVYSILLVALSLASMQFSTRILRQLARDRVSQVTLGLFVGTFLYCILVLRVIQTTPEPSVPGLAVGGAIFLALVSMGQLLYFIHHIVQFIQANFLVEHIARETEAVIDEVFPAGPPQEALALPDGWLTLPRHRVLSDRSGYVQILDLAAIAEVARALEGVVVVRTTCGHFATEGLTLLEVHAERGPSAAQIEALRGAFDVGPIRTMQDDAEWGFRQIVDIALKAISPAVNDPSTAVTCIDHLGRLLVRAAGRHVPKPFRGAGPDGLARVVVRESSLAALVDLAFNQIRQVGGHDMAVALRLMRVLGHLAELVTDARARERVALHARLVREAAERAHVDEDCEALRARHAIVTGHLDEASATPAP